MSVPFLNLDASDIYKGTAVPPPNGRADKTYSAYVRAQLFHANKDQEWKSKTVKTKDTPGEGADVTWNEQLEWTFELDDLAFIRSVVIIVFPFTHRD